MHFTNKTDMESIDENNKSMQFILLKNGEISECLKKI